MLPSEQEEMLVSHDASIAALQADIVTLQETISNGIVAQTTANVTADEKGLAALQNQVANLTTLVQSLTAAKSS